MIMGGTMRSMNRCSAADTAALSARVVAAVLLLALLALMSGAPAANASGELVALPATVKDSQPVTVRWAPRDAPDPAVTYRLEVSNARIPGCQNNTWVPVPATWKKGARVSLVVRPTAGGRFWCTRTTVWMRLVAVMGTGRSAETKELAATYAGVVDDPRTPPNPPGVFSAPGLVRVSVSPATGIAPTSTVAVSWRTDRKLRRNEGYQVVFDGGGSPTASSPGCIRSLVRIVGRRTPRGKLIRVRLNPLSRQGASGWCLSIASGVQILRVVLNANGQADPALQTSIDWVGAAQLPPQVSDASGSG